MSWNRRKSSPNPNEVPKALRSDALVNGESPQNLETWVLAMIRGAFKSRELLEAERPDDVPPFDDPDDGRVMLQNWAALVNRQGMILAHLLNRPGFLGDVFHWELNSAM
jgi:hypothetical protein